MNEEIKKEWVAALRSGKYKQGKKYLRNKKDDTFCCAGVLCDILLKKAGKTWDEDEGSGFYAFNSAHVLSISEREAVGLPIGLQLEKNGRTDSIYVMNDHRDLSFNEIADLIESQF